MAISSDIQAAVILHPGPISDDEINGKLVFFILIGGNIKTSKIFDKLYLVSLQRSRFLLPYWEPKLTIFSHQKGWSKLKKNCLQNLRWETVLSKYEYVQCSLQIVNGFVSDWELCETIPWRYAWMDCAVQWWWWSYCEECKRGASRHVELVYQTCEVKVRICTSIMYWNRMWKIIWSLLIWLRKD